MDWLILAQQGAAQNVTNQAMEWVNAIGLVALLVVFIADKAMAYLKGRGIDLNDITAKIDELHAWHNHDDPDQPGIKIWWNQKYIAEIIKELAKIQRTQVDMLRDMHRDQQLTTKILEEQVKVLTDMRKEQDRLNTNMDKLLEVHKP